MATWDQPHEHRRPRFGGLLDALFGEAWEIQRRRRRRRTLILVAVIAVVVGAYLGGERSGGSRRSELHAPTIVHRGSLASVVLPGAAAYSSLAVVGSHLIVWGDGQGDEYSAPESYSTSARCQVAEVDPVSLTLEHVRRGACADPALYGERVLLDETTSRGGDSGVIDDLRISARTAHGGYRVGPVIARYDQCSDCHDVSIYGAGSLWIYVLSPLGSSPSSAELLRISETTGQVAQRWAVPALARPVMATDRDGLWLAPSLFSGTPNLHPSVAEVRAYQSLYRVTPGMRRLQRTYWLGSSGARWIVASGHTVWVNHGAPTTTRVTELSGSRARPVFSSRPATGECLDMGEGPTAIGGDASVGIDCLGANGLGYTTVFRYGSRSGELDASTPVRGLPDFSSDVPATLTGGSFFFLEPSGGDTGQRIGSFPAGTAILYRLKTG